MTLLQSQAIEFLTSSNKYPIIKLEALMNRTADSCHRSQTSASSHESMLSTDFSVNAEITDPASIHASRKAWMKHPLKVLPWARDFSQLGAQGHCLSLGTQRHEAWIILVSCEVTTTSAPLLPIHNSPFIHSRAFPWPDVYHSCVTLQLFCRGGRSGFWKTFEYTHKYRLGLLCLWINN